MKLYSTLLLTLVTTTFAQRPPNTTICDYWAPVILGSSTASDQALLITLLINTVVLGNYTTPNTGVPVAGIASPAVYNDTQINLLPFFTGALNSTNRGGNQGMSVPLLDDGAATALSKNMSSNGNVNSAQLYVYISVVLFTVKGGPAFPSYQGVTSMYEVHRYMDLDKYQMGFFIEQCVLSAKSLGISPADAELFGNTLGSLFNFRCSPPALIANEPATAPEFQSVCIAENCPLDEKAECAAYPNNGVALIPVNVTQSQGGNGSTTTSSSPAAGSPTQTSASTRGEFSSAIVLVFAAIAASFMVDVQVWN